MEKLPPFSCRITGSIPALPNSATPLPLAAVLVAQSFSICQQQQISQRFPLTKHDKQKMASDRLLPGQPQLKTVQRRL